MHAASISARASAPTSLPPAADAVAVEEEEEEEEPIT
jgi:hypothetical protein